ncbi:hypothetical protein HK101_006363, partial [Irineochytrium annulatum]
MGRRASVSDRISGFGGAKQTYPYPTQQTYPYPTSTTTAAAASSTSTGPPKPSKFSAPAPVQHQQQQQQQKPFSYANNPFANTAKAPSPASVSAPDATNAPTSIANNPFLKNNVAAVPPAPSPSYSTPSLSRPQPQSAYQNNANVSTGGIDFQGLAQRFPYFTASEISAFHQQFTSFDKEGRGTIHQSDLQTVAQKAGESHQILVAKLTALRLTSSDTQLVSFESFLQACSALRQEKGAGVANRSKIVLHGQGGENTTHTINEDEKMSFVEHINFQLGGDKDLRAHMPIDVYTMEIFSKAKDGLILAKLINDSVPNTIDERVLNTSSKLNAFQMTENNNVVVNSAKAIGCSVVNIGSQDLMEGREHLILGLIWQIIKMGLQAKIDIKFHPEIVRLLEEGETLEGFLKLPAEQILIRWFNYHLKKAGWHRKVGNFSGDVKDGENYT